MMEVRWLGHSCFQIRGKEAVIITDPYHPSLGYSLGSPKADIVTLSHSHSGHSYIEGIGGAPKKIDGPGEYEMKGVFIIGIATFHDNERGRERGKNTVYLLEIDGMTLCHLGDIGHLPTPRLVEEMSNVDVLFLPVGGVSTIALPTAIEMIKRLNPRIAIPMHYKTPALTMNLEPVDGFLKQFGIKQVVTQPKLIVNQSSTAIDTTQIVVLDYLGK